MKTFACIWLLTLVVLASVRAASQDTNVYRIDLTRPAVFRNLFDAGLRPIWDGRNKSSCVVEDKVLAFVLNDGLEVVLPYNNCRFEFLENDTIKSISGHTSAYATREVQQVMGPIGRQFGRQDDELRRFLDKVDHGLKWFGVTEPGFGVGNARPPQGSGQLWYRLYLVWAGGEKPVKIVCEIDWERPRAETIRYSRVSPLRPPAGYEQFSMEPPPYVAEWIRKGEPPPPDVERRYGKEGIQRLRDEYKASKGTTNFSSQPQPPPSPVSASPTITEAPQGVSASPSWPKWLPIGASLAAFFGWMVWRRLRSKI